MMVRGYSQASKTARVCVCVCAGLISVYLIAGGESCRLCVPTSVYVRFEISEHTLNTGSCGVSWQDICN